MNLWQNCVTTTNSERAITISAYSPDDILPIADLMNALPRKILGYHTPEALFGKELDRIYAA